MYVYKNANFVWHAQKEKKKKEREYLSQVPNTYGYLFRVEGVVE